MEPIPSSSTHPTLPFKLNAAYGGPRAVPPVPPVNRAPNLSAGVVPGRITFDTVEISGRPIASDDGGAIPMYRNPAAKNAAATGIALGRTLDLKG